MRKYQSLYPAFVLLLLGAAILYQSNVPIRVINPSVVQITHQPELKNSQKLKNSKEKFQAEKMLHFKSKTFRRENI